jgi:hypothetical protein
MHIAEPSAELSELTALVTDLAKLLEGVVPGDDAGDVRRRLEALLHRLR